MNCLLCNKEMVIGEDFYSSCTDCNLHYLTRKGVRALYTSLNEHLSLSDWDEKPIYVYRDICYTIDQMERIVKLKAFL